jgi:hypothetical protein
MPNFTPIGVQAVVDGIKQFDRDMVRMESAIDDTTGSINAMAGTINFKLNEQLEEMQKQSGLLGAILENQVVDVLDDVQDEMQETTRSTKSFGEKLGNVINIASNAASAIIDVTRFVIDLGKAAFDAAVNIGKMAIGLGKQAFDAAVDFESAFAGVIKTTDGLVDEFGNLTQTGQQVQQDFRDLAKEVPVTVEALLEIGEAGGQLGVAREDLIGFTESIAAMEVATNLTRDEAATSFAQIANVMGTTERIGAEAFSRLGSTLPRQKRILPILHLE